MVQQLPCTVSLLTSSTDKYLSDIPKLYKGWTEDERPDALELYVFRECDLDDLPVFWDVKEPRSSVAEMVAALKPSDISELAEHIKERIPTMPIAALATYFPEITSVDLRRKNHAVKALANSVLLADQLGVSVVEMVAGRHDEECTHHYKYRHDKGSLVVRDCDIVFSCEDHTRPESDSDNVSSMKLRWLMDGLREVHHRVKRMKLRTNVQLFLEMEPGRLFVLSRPRHIRRVLVETVRCTLPTKDKWGRKTGKRYPLLSFNCDIGHCLLTTYAGENYPGNMWAELFKDKRGRIGTPATRLKNFHISDHPYNRMHIDRPPTSNPDYATFHSIRPNFSDPIHFAPWLNCVLCVAERGRQTNVSLELEAEIRTEPLWEGITSVKQALREIANERAANPRWADRSCGGSSPLRPGCPDFIPR